jgi:DNA-binding NtrC family response regulator
MKTILLIDDEPENLGIFTEILKRFGYEVIAMQDGISAISAVREGAQVDLVITDYRIAGMDGLEILTSLKKLAPSVPSIMLTAYSSIETYLKAVNLGVFEYLNKPVNPKELGRVVKAALEKTQASVEYPNQVPSPMR